MIRVISCSTQHMLLVRLLSQPISWLVQNTQPSQPITWLILTKLNMNTTNSLNNKPLKQLY